MMAEESPNYVFSYMALLGMGVEQIKEVYHAKNPLYIKTRDHVIPLENSHMGLKGFNLLFVLRDLGYPTQQRQFVLYESDGSSNSRFNPKKSRLLLIANGSEYIEPQMAKKDEIKKILKDLRLVPEQSLDEIVEQYIYLEEPKFLEIKGKN